MNSIKPIPYIIAEIGVNYYDIAIKEGTSPIQAAKQMIKAIKDAGGHAAKFQSYKAGKIASKNSPAYWDQKEEPTTSQYELFKKFDSFGKNEYKELADYCKSINIDFLSTPFDLEAVDFLDPLMDYFKVASADITNDPLLKKIASKNKPIILSTGASILEEIQEAIEIIHSVNKNINITLLHCVLSYPTENKHANLNRIKYLSKKFTDKTIGYSDHTRPDPSMSILTAAYLFGAQIIEKHFTLDKTLQGNDHYHAMDPNDLRRFINNLTILNAALQSNEVNYQSCEEPARKQARRSIVLNKNLKKGSIIKNIDLIMKRPGNGISPRVLQKVLGKKINQDLKEDTILKFEHLNIIQ